MKYVYYLDYCHTPIFDLTCHWHVSLDPTYVRSLTWSISDVSVKISAERYFKIPHFLFRVGPSSLNFIFLNLILIFVSYLIFFLKPILISAFVKNFYYLPHSVSLIFILFFFLLLLLFVSYYFCPIKSLKMVLIQRDSLSISISIQNSLLRVPHPQHESRKKLSHLNPKCRFSAIL